MSNSTQTRKRQKKKAGPTLKSWKEDVLSFLISKNGHPVTSKTVKAAIGYSRSDNVLFSLVNEGLIGKQTDSKTGLNSYFTTPKTVATVREVYSTPNRYRSSIDKLFPTETLTATKTSTDAVTSTTSNAVQKAISAINTIEQNLRVLRVALGEIEETTEKGTEAFETLGQIFQTLNGSNGVAVS